MFTIVFHSLLLEMFSHRNEKWLWVLMITIAGSGLCTRRRRLWDAPLNCTFSSFFASFSLPSCSPNFRSCPTPASIVIQTQTRGIEKGKKWRWFTRVGSSVPLFGLYKHTLVHHGCILSELLHLSPVRAFTRYLTEYPWTAWSPDVMSCVNDDDGRK